MIHFGRMIRNMKIRTKIACIFLVVFIPIIISIVLVNNIVTNKIVLDTIKSNKSLAIENIMQEVDASIKDMERISLITFSDSNLQKVLAKKFTSITFEYIQDQRWVEGFLLNLITIRNEISTIRIVTTSANLYKYSTNAWPFNRQYYYFDSSFVLLSQKEQGGSIILGANLLDDVMVPETASFAEKTVFSIVRQINSLKDKGPIGYIKIDTPVSVLANIVKSYHLDQSILIISDGSFNTVYESNYALPKYEIEALFKPDLSTLQNGSNYSTKVDGKEYLATLATSKYSNWHIMTLTPSEEYMSNSFLLRDISIILCLVGILLALLLAVMLSKSLSKPITALRQSMLEVESGNLSVNSAHVSNDEIGDLTQSFNRMISRLHDLMNNVYYERIKRQDAEIKQKNAQLGFLQNQINPHFLYNTLDTIRITAALNHDKTVEDMLCDLALFFRLSIDKGEDVTTISKEVDLIECYFKILKFRFKGKFKLHIHIPEEIMACEIPKFILQPIVENAIHHGLEMKKEKGAVSVQASRDNDTLEILVSDNGKGMEKELIESYSVTFSQEILSIDQESAQQSHIGLVNVNQRLQLLYGMQYGVSLSSNPTGGLTVKLRLKPNWHY